MVSARPVRATTPLLPRRACHVRAEAAPTATVPVGRAPQLAQADPVPVGLVPQPVQVDPVPRLVQADPVRVHPAPEVPVLLPA
ncbi:hypothetical protein QF031_002601 [Pseudarthrobacter defluvii]|nr:hypothetical protein [Pseudarthrobacter defluvii]